MAERFFQLLKGERIRQAGLMQPVMMRGADVFNYIGGTFYNSTELSFIGRTIPVEFLNVCADIPNGQFEQERWRSRIAREDRRFANAARNAYVNGLKAAPATTNERPIHPNNSQSQQTCAAKGSTRECLLPGASVPEPEAGNR